MGAESLYQSLPLPSPLSIRVLTIDEGDTSTRGIVCALKTVTLKNKPDFIALSYTWHLPLGTGDEPDSEHNIICNGVPLMVFDNVHAALKRLVERGREQEYWIDTLCIDQSSDAERTQQVQIMAEIFSSARKVIVWLGPEHPWLGNALELIDALTGLSDGELARIHPSTLEHPSVRSILGDQYHKREYWQALVHFFCRRWFGRAWVVQELLLAKDTLILCGDHEIEWWKLAKVSDFLALSSWTKVFRDPTFFGLSGLRPQHNSPTKLKAAQALVAEPKGRNVLLYSLIRARRYDCDNPIDKVFSVYGIARTKSPQGTLVPNPKYEITYPVGEAYFDTAISILNDSKDLLLLAYAEGECFRRATVGYPSWVPDWSVRDTIGLGMTGYDRFDAAKGRSRVMKLHCENRVLAIEAAIFDSIEVVGDSKRDVERNNTLDSWLDIVLGLPQPYSTNERRLEVFWKTLIANGHRKDPSDEESVLKFRRSFRLWLRDLIYQRESEGPMLAKLMQLQEHGDLVSSTEEMRSLAERSEVGQNMEGRVDHQKADEMILASHFDVTFSHATCLRLFRTEGGLLGVGSMSMKIGDKVCIASGSRVPLLIRGGSPRYELVGAAYLHGIMDGEAETQNKLVFQTIELE